MIDTVKIYTKIPIDIYNAVKNNAIVKKAVNYKTGEELYNIVNDSLEGSYSSSLSVRVGAGIKYNFVGEYYIEIEGSLHKIIRGYNSHHGFYDLKYICNYMIGIAENYYKIELPQLEFWFLGRVDVAIVFDLQEQENIANYINNLRMCSFPRRVVHFYKNQSLYSSGTYTTLKIYNKMLEFQKHDISKLRNTNFKLYNYLREIRGFIRFEVEIKKRKLLAYKNSKEKYIKIINYNYQELRNIWSEEFMKLLKINGNEQKVLYEREEVKERLFNTYKPVRARNLYRFYLSVKLEGLENVKDTMCSTSYYDYLKYLKQCNIDLSQTYNVEITNTYINFNPFFAKEVA